MFSLEILPINEENRPLPRQGTITAFYDNYLYIFGGRVSTKHRLKQHEGKKRAYMNDFWRVDLSSLIAKDEKTLSNTSWESIDLKEGYISERYNLSSCVWNNNWLIFGGVSYEGYSNEVQIFNFDTFELNKILTKGDIPEPRAGHISEIYDNKLYIHGGSCSYIKESDISPYFDTIFTLDLSTFIWSKLDTKGIKPTPRNWHSSTLVKYKNITYLAIFGGYMWDPLSGIEHYYNDLSILNLTTNEWKLVKTQRGDNNIPHIRNRCSLIVHEDKFIIHGGNYYEYGFDIFLNDVWSISISCLDSKNKQKWEKLEHHEKKMFQLSKEIQGLDLRISHHSIQRLSIKGEDDIFIAFGEEVDNKRRNDIKLIRYSKV